MAGYGQAQPGGGGNDAGHDTGSSSLMHGLRQSDDAIDPRDPEFSPLASNAAVPPYLAGDPAYDPAASQYNAGGYDDPYGGAGPYDACYSAQPSCQSGSAYDIDSHHGPAGDVTPAPAAAQQQTSDGGRSVSVFSIEAATPPQQKQKQKLGPDGRPRQSVRRSSIEVSMHAISPIDKHQAS